MTVADVITGAFRRLNVVESNAVPSPEDMADGFLRFKAMLGLWRLQRLTIPTVQRVSAPLVAFKQTYTVGIGGDLACGRPAQPAGLTWTLLDSTVPATETPLVPLTNEQAKAIPQKTVAAPRPIQVWYQPTSGVPPTTTLGLASLYPVPAVVANLSLCLYAPIGIADPAATSSTVIVPEGYDLPLMDNLARVLWPEWRENVPIDPELRASAIEGLGWLKTNNVRQSDLGLDVSWLQGSGTYDITTDQGELMQFAGLIGGSYTSASRVADSEMLMNWYVEAIESPSAAVKAALYPTPGFSTFITLPNDTGTRGLFTINGVTLACVGGSLYKIAGTTTGPTSTLLGALAHDANPAQIVFNGAIGNQAFIGSGTMGYCLNLATNALTNPLVNKCTLVGMLDGFVISFDLATGRMYLSNLNDATTWDPTQFAQRSSAPDSWKAMIVVPPDIWMLGSVTGDIWYNAGAFPFPFAPRVGLNFKYGIAATFSAAAIGTTVLWLAQAIEGTGVVVRSVGYDPQRISTYALEDAIARYSLLPGGIANAEAMTYTDHGHPFYCLRFPTPERTWVYDLTMNTWHERGYWNPSRNQFEVWRPRVHTYAFDRHLIGDDQTGTIQVMDVTNGSEFDGSAIRRVRRTAAAMSELRQVPMRVAEVLLENGVGNPVAPGDNPAIMWRNSDDGGRTWGNERQATIGRTGQTRVRVRFWRLGVPRDRVIELSASDPVPWRILSLFLNNDTAQ